MRDRPVGIFDSGLGGLTVLKALMERLPAEDYVYLGDTARVPYGTKSAETVVRYSLQNVAFLVEQGVKLVVVACNTASANALSEVQGAWPKLPVVGVIGPGARAATARTRNRRVGVIGTRATVQSGAYDRAIAAIDPGVTVLSRACPLFVALAEEGWTDNEVARLAAREYLTALAAADIDTLLLGCTHYPLLRDTIAGVMGPGVQLIDSARETAEEVAEILASNDLGRVANAAPRRWFHVTDLPGHFHEVGERFLGEALREVFPVDLTGGGAAPAGG